MDSYCPNCGSFFCIEASEEMKKTAKIGDVIGAIRCPGCDKYLKVVCHEIVPVFRLEETGDLPEGTVVYQVKDFSAKLGEITLGR